MRVQLAWPWSGPDGKKYKKGDVVDVPDHRGRALKRAGLARDPDTGSNAAGGRAGDDKKGAGK